MERLSDYEIQLRSALTVLWTLLRHAGVVLLRLPGLYTFELWYRHTGWSTSAKGQPAALWDVSRFERLLGDQQRTQMAILIEWARTREMDDIAGGTLKYSLLFLILLVLLLPYKRLIRVYMHGMALLMLTLAHYMSNKYVQLEVMDGGPVNLDGFVTLERHGFHFLAQVMIAMLTAYFLAFSSDVGRVGLAAYTSPIIARMCGVPPESLYMVHNGACTFFMLSTACYLLIKGPRTFTWFKQCLGNMKTLLQRRGIIEGLVVTWRQSQIARLLAVFWGAIFVAQLTSRLTQLASLPDSIEVVDMPILVLASMAECTCSPLTLLALALAVSYYTSASLAFTKWFLHGGSVETPPMAAGNMARAPGVTHMIHTGYCQGLILVVLSLQTGLLWLPVAQKAFLLGLALFITMSAGMQSAFDVLEPHLMQLGASTTASFARHLRAWLVTACLMAMPLVAVGTIRLILPFDIWLLIIMSNCLLTALQTISVAVVYALFVIEARSSQPWESLDDIIFVCRSITRMIEFLLALTVIMYGLYQWVFGPWNALSAAVLVGHSYFNVWRRLQAGWASYQQRRQAGLNIKLLPRASRASLTEKGENCAICFAEMSEARVTPCGHVFHGVCLRKWLFVTQSCPLCHASIELGEGKPTVDVSPQPDVVPPDDDAAHDPPRDEHVRSRRRMPTEDQAYFYDDSDNG